MVGFCCNWTLEPVRWWDVVSNIASNKSHHSPSLLLSIPFLSSVFFPSFLCGYLHGSLEGRWHVRRVREMRTLYLSNIC